MTIDEKLEEFKLFCVNTGISIMNSSAIQYGQQFYVERNGEHAYMNIYNNGNAFCQAPSSLLKVCLDAWAKRSVCYRSGLVPDYYCSWREWTENTKALRRYVDSNGFPDENSVPEQYDMNREIIFHDYMMRNAITCNIEWRMIEFVVESWLRHNCFMNLDVDLIVHEIQSNCSVNYT